MDGEIGKRRRRLKSAMAAGSSALGGLALTISMLAKPISSLDELKGKKIRSAQTEGRLEGLKFFGATPTPIPFDEIYLALHRDRRWCADSAQSWCFEQVVRSLQMSSPTISAWRSTSR